MHAADSAGMQTAASREWLQSQLRSEIIVQHNQCRRPTQKIYRRDSRAPRYGSNCAVADRIIWCRRLGVLAHAKAARPSMRQNGFPLAARLAPLRSEFPHLAVSICQTPAKSEMIHSRGGGDQPPSPERESNVSETPGSLHGRLVGRRWPPPPQAIREFRSRSRA